MRDVIFQCDVPHMDGLNVAAEGMKFRDSEWNTNDIRQLVHTTAPFSFDGLDVINGGLQVGSPDALTALYEAVLPFIETPNRGYSDQAVTNWLIHRGIVPATVHHPDSSDFCMTGEPYRLGLRKASWNGTHYVDEQGRPWRIIHQHDRIAKFRMPL
jgi:hypothetical protein